MALKTEGGERTAFPWNQVMAFGLGVLSLPSREFWSLTPREIDCAIKGYYGGAVTEHGPSRSDLDQLMRQFPDGK